MSAEPRRQGGGGGGQSERFVLSNGISLGPQVAAGLQADMLRYNIQQAKIEKNGEKEIYLRHLLASKINVPSNNMLSKAGKFFNFRNIGYETINQQNKRSLAEVIDSFEHSIPRSPTDRWTRDPESEHNQNGRNSHLTKRVPFKMTGLIKKRRNEFDQHGEEEIDSKTLQFKQDKQVHINELKSIKISSQSCTSNPSISSSTSNSSNNKSTTSQKIINRDDSPSSCFIRQGREELNKLLPSPIPDERSIHFAPSFAKIHHQAPAHTFLPLPTNQRREDVNTLPDCIIRGNLCEYAIRSITTELKTYSTRITEGLMKLNALEKKLVELRGEKFKKVDFSKVKLEIETIIEQKRAIGEDILDAQKSFISVRTVFETKVRKNIDAFEKSQFHQNINANAEKDHPICNHINFKTMLSRKELFPAQNVEDVCERLYNNYEEMPTHLLEGIFFDLQVGRTQREQMTERELKGPNMDDVTTQFENVAFVKQPCFVRMKTPPKPTAYAQKLGKMESDIRAIQDGNWKRVVEGHKALSEYHATPTLTSLKNQIGRETLASHQIRSVRTNQNFIQIPQGKRIARSNSNTTKEEKSIKLRNASNSPK